MKRLIKNTILLIVPVILLIVVLPVDRRLLFQGLIEDCSNRSIWIYDRIHENKKPVDLAILGSSHTINGVNDELISEKLKINAINIGYCRFGENMIYVLLKELIKTKKVKIVIIEVREDEDRYSHPVFPYLAETKDVLFEEPLFNKSLFSDYYRHFYYRLETIKNFLFNNIENIQFRREDYGFGSSPDTAKPEFLKEIKEKRELETKELTMTERNFYMKFPRSYLSKISGICRKNKIKIYFLYLPSYGSKIQMPKEYSTYINYGKIVIPPTEIFEKIVNWYDENHLNQTGAKELSIWLSDYLKNN